MKTNLSPLNSPSWSSLSKMGKMGKMGQRWEDIVGHKLPSITQEILGKYRSSQAKSISYKEELVMCEILWFSSPPSSEQCKCDKTNGRCSLVMKWISGCYLWKNDERFSRAYQSYNKLEMETFLEDSELKKRLSKKLLQLGIEADSSCFEVLFRVTRNYIRHTIYCSKASFTNENELYLWFAIGIFFHVGYKPNQCLEEIMFWSIDIAMKSLGTVTKLVLGSHVAEVMQLIKTYFVDWHRSLQGRGINLQTIVEEWMNELLMGSMQVESIGFFIDRIISVGWTYIYKVFLSYFEKQMIKVVKDCLLELPSDKENIMRTLVDTKQEWPIVFCDANNFKIESINAKTNLK